MGPEGSLDNDYKTDFKLHPSRNENVKGQPFVMAVMNFRDL